MTRKKSAARKAPSKASSKSAAKKSAASKPSPKASSKAAPKSGSSAKSSPRISSAAYDQLAARTLEMWREQMMAIAESPKAVHELSKAMEPIISLFTQALDMWLMMADRLHTSMPSHAWPQGFSDHFASGNPFATHAQKPAEQKREKQRAKSGSRSGKKPAPAKSASASPLYGDRNATVAELAKRVAGLKQQRPAPAATSARMASAAPANEDVAGSRPKRRRKA